MFLPSLKKKKKLGENSLRYKTQYLSFLNYVITETFISTKTNEMPHKIPDELSLT